MYTRFESATLLSRLSQTYKTNRENTVAVYSIPQFGVELLYIEYLGREDWIVEEVLQEAGNVLLNRDQVGSAR